MCVVKFSRLLLFKVAIRLSGDQGPEKLKVRHAKARKMMEDLFELEMSSLKIRSFISFSTVTFSLKNSLHKLSYFGILYF